MLLAGCTYFAYFGSDRVIVRQDHVSKALYFIIHGKVSVSHTTWDAVLQQYETKVIHTLTTGDIFGEASLLYNLPRRYTITTISPTEFLILYRDDFDVVLKDTVKTEWDRIMVALGGFTYFESWNEFTKKECRMVAKIKKFAKDDTILGDGCGNEKWVHFVLKGRCRMIEDICIGESEKYTVHKGRLSLSVKSTVQMENKIKTIPSGKTLVELESRTNMAVMTSTEEMAARDNLSLRPFGPPLIDTRFMQVCIFSAKACFGIGEPMERRRIVAMTDVECLIIPRYWILTKGSPNLWTRIRTYLQQHIPTTEELFFEFKEQKKWRKFKNDLIKKHIKKQPCNCPQNVPYSIRMQQDFEYCKRL